MKKTPRGDAHREWGRMPQRQQATKDSTVFDIKPYKQKRGEEYMGERMAEHFRNILLSWKRQLMEEVDRTLHHMQDDRLPASSTTRRSCE